ncbi:unnamed protein product [Pedinophyceae sp. YPF-701]|nr:unnamed protein product [Pedinophyceae sp. YPF-701]
MSFAARSAVAPQVASVAPARRAAGAVCRAAPSDSAVPQGSRREVLQGAALLAASLAAGPASAAAKKPKGYNICRDDNDNYTFLYPFGWQEVSVDGLDVCYKDVIEPLESVSVSLVLTDKESVDEFGTPLEIADTLVATALSNKRQKTKVLDAKRVERQGRPYVEFEFLAEAPNYTRHALGVVTVSNGKFYIVSTGANERRWGKMQKKVKTVVDSFEILYGNPAA